MTFYSGSWLRTLQGDDYNYDADTNNNKYKYEYEYLALTLGVYVQERCFRSLAVEWC